MIDATLQLKEIFATEGIALLPAMATDSSAQIPCVTYFESENTDNRIGDTIGYSNIRYQIEVWSRDEPTLMELSQKVDTIMKKHRFARHMSGYQIVDGLHRRILGYRRLVKENL